MPRAAVVGAPVLAIDDVGQAVGVGRGADDHVAAVAAVAAVGTAAWERTSRAGSCSSRRRRRRP